MKVCEKCAKVYHEDEDHETCPRCDGPLVEYDQALENAQDYLDEENILERFLEMIVDMETLGEKRPWYVPALNTIGYNTPNIGCSVRLNIAHFTSPEITRKWLIDLKENQGYGEIFQWVLCPECGWDVPQAEITIDGCCFFCLTRKKQGNLCHHDIPFDKKGRTLVCDTCEHHRGISAYVSCMWKHWKTPDPEEKQEG